MKYLKRWSMLFIVAIAMNLAVSCSEDNDVTEEKNQLPEIAVQTFTVAEDIAANEIIGKVVAADKDGDVLAFSIKKDEDDLFAIATDGTLTLKEGKSLDYETKTSHTISVEVTDEKATVTTTITISVTDVEENNLSLAKDYTVISNWTHQDGTFGVGSITIGSTKRITTQGYSFPNAPAEIRDLWRKETRSFMDFTRPLAAGEVLEVSFDSHDVTNFTTPGWAGISLYTGGSQGTESVFVGSPSGHRGWGFVSRFHNQNFGNASRNFPQSISRTEEVAKVFLTYAYDTGRCRLRIGEKGISVIIAKNQKIDAIRIGATTNNTCDITISNLSVKASKPDEDKGLSL